MDFGQWINTHQLALHGMLFDLFIHCGIGLCCTVLEVCDEIVFLLRQLMRNYKSAYVMMLILVCFLHVLASVFFN